MKSVKKPGMNFYLIFSVMGLLVSLTVCTLMFFQFRSFTKSSYLGTLERVATLIEKRYPILHDIEKLREGAENDEDWFWETAEELNDFVASFGLAYIYCIEKTKDKGYVFRISSSIRRDYHPEWLGSRVWNDNALHPEEVEIAYTTQKTVFSTEPFVDEWGTLVSVYMPIITDGKTVGLLGVDYDVSYINGLQRRVLIFLIISFAASAVLTGVLAYVGSRSVVITIEEREKTTREALERKTEIEKLMYTIKEASETRTAFLSNISNTMANPINNIIRLSSLLSKYTEITEDHNKNLEMINDEGLKLYNVINDILDILKIEAGKLKINLARYNLPKFIYDITSPYSMLTENKQIQYRLIIDNNLPVDLIGDELRIRQICHHLLTNAFKYTNEGSVTVHITGRRQNDTVLLVVKIIDTGAGIAQNKLNSIFINYGQGTGGLGLYICRQLAEMMKGTLTVTSERGKGSAFTLAVPQKLASSETIDPDTIKKLATFKN